MAEGPVTRSLPVGPNPTGAATLPVNAERPDHSSRWLSQTGFEKTIAWFVHSLT